jgi:Icc protein
VDPPALVYQVDAFPPAGRLRGLRGAAISRVDLVDGAAVTTAMPLGTEPVHDVAVAKFPGCGNGSRHDRVRR